MNRKKVFEQTWMTFLSQRSETEEEEEEGYKATNTVNGKYLDQFFPINWVSQKNGGNKYFINHIFIKYFVSNQIFYSEPILIFLVCADTFTNS